MTGTSSKGEEPAQTPSSVAPKGDRTAGGTLDASAEGYRVQVAYFGQALTALQWIALIFSAVCAIAYFLLGDASIGLIGAVILLFALLAAFTRCLLRRGFLGVAIAVGCSSILGASFVGLFVRPTLFPTIAVTSLLAASVALPYATTRMLKIVMAACWIGAVNAGLVGSLLVTRSPERLPYPLFDATFVALTLAAAAGVSLLVLWQFRMRLMGTLAQVREAEEVLRYEATHDDLTDLPNRSFLVERLSRTIERSRKDPSYAFAVLFLDLDRFKHVNDSLGHTIGDELLKEVACRISSCVHPTDTVVRLGGDEFVVLLEGLSEAGEAEEVAVRIQQTLRDPVRLHGHELYATASVGVVTEPEGHVSPEELLRDADTAMYRAKEGGKARHAVFDAKMRQKAVSLLKLETDLRRAVEGGEFVVHYQPIIWLHGDVVTGFEALVRWQHPERGLLLPDDFVPFAEETGLIHEIDRFVLGEACRRAAAWRRGFPKQFPPSVNVNLSPTRLVRSGLPEEVARVLKETGLPGRALALELTEGAIMEDTEAALKTLSRLRELGVRVHVDDFGAGHSSLGLLHRLPVDALKIDRSFVSRMGGAGGPEEGVEIVRTILTMAHQLGMDAVAEGVETEGQLEILKEMECDYAQGYRFSRPVDAEGVGAILDVEPAW